MNDNSQNRLVKIKVCGMKYADNILQLGALQPDYIGFIFSSKSARFFDSEIPELPKSIKKTGVFVNEKADIVLEMIQLHDLQAVQLHGSESPSFCKTLQSLTSRNIEIIKVFSVGAEFDFAQLAPYEDVCDYYLFDTKGKFPGGNGIAFNWEILHNYPSAKPFFLSGGIGINELESLHKLLKIGLPIYAIDFNSKLEIEPGLKNIELCEKVFATF